MTLRRHRSVTSRIPLAQWRWRRHRSVTGWFERSEYPPDWCQRVVALWKSAPAPGIPRPVRAPLQGAMLGRFLPGVLASLARPGYWAETPSASLPSGFSRFSIPNTSQNSLTYFYTFETLPFAPLRRPIIIRMDVTSILTQRRKRR